MGTPAVLGPMTVDGGGPLTGGAVSNPTRQASQINQAVIAFNLPTQQAFRQNMATVYIETAFASDEWEPGGVIDWQQMFEGADGVDTTATLRVSALDFQSGEHFAAIRERLTPDRRIRIGMKIWGSASAVLFQGFVKSDSINWSDRGQGLSAMCLSEPQEYTRVGRGNETSIVNGRMMRNDPTGEWESSRVADLVSRVSGLQAIFNAGGLGNMSSVVQVRMDGSNPDDASDQHRVHLFETDGNIIAAPWTYRHALRYLLFFWVAQKPLAPNLDTAAFFYDTRPEVEVTDLLSDLLDRPVRPDLSIESLNVDEAIKTLCDAAGLHYHWETFGRSREVDNGSGFITTHRFRLVAPKTSSSGPRPAWRRMGHPRVLSVPRRKPFEDLSAFSTRVKIFATRAIQAQLTVDTSRQINRPVYLGGYKEYECSVLMRPGWIPHSSLDNVVTPTENGGLLTGDEFDDAVAAAKTVWETRFKEFEGGGRVSDRTKYHAQHPDFHEVEKVFRTWIFPDDDFYVQGLDGAESFLARNGTGIPARPGWTRPYYHPYVLLGGETIRAWGMWYRDSKYGGGLPLATRPDDLPGIEDWVPRERPFQDTQGRFDFSTTTRAPIVRIHFGENLDPYEVPWSNHPDWVRFAGSVEISRTRAAIRFLDDNVWNSPAFLVETRLPFKDNAIERYIEGRFWVQVTACVRGDKRMRYAPTHFLTGGVLPSLRLRHQVRDLGYDKFQVRTIDEGNSFLTARKQENDELLVDPDENFRNRDDTDALAQFGDQDGANNLSHGVAGYWQQPFLDIAGFSGKIGDSFVGVTGLSIQWDTYPVVIGRLHTKTLQGQQMTKLILADKRHTPEVMT